MPVHGQGIIEFQKEQAKLEAKEAEEKAKDLPKEFDYFCPACLYQTNELTEFCPKCGNKELRRTTRGVNAAKGKPVE